MRFPNYLKVYGDTSYRGDCPAEDAELTTFFNQLRKNRPELANRVFHVENEGKRTKMQAQVASMKGMVAGMPDVVCIGRTAGLIEMKRRDHTKSRWQKNQQDVLLDCHNAGAFVCVALGWEAAMMAVDDWLLL